MAGALWLAADARGDDEGLVPVRLQLPWTHQFEFAGFYAAMELGMYRFRGMDVEIAQGGPDILPLEECLSGRAQIGVGGSEILLARLRGAPVVTFGVLFQHSASALLVLEDSGIRQVRDLAGKRIEMGNQASDAEPLAMLLQVGLDEDTYTHIPSSFSLDNLLAGRVDAVSVFITNQPYRLNRQGVSFRLLRPSAHGIDFYGDLLYTTEEFSRNNRDLVRAFKMASLEGWSYALNHPDEVAAIIEAKYPAALFPRSREHLLYEYEQVKQLIRSDIVALGHMNPGRFRHMADTFQSLKLVTNIDELEGFLFDPDVDTESAGGGWMLVIALLGAVAAGVSGICWFRIRKAGRGAGNLAALSGSLGRRLRGLEERTGIGVFEWTPGSEYAMCDEWSSPLLLGSGGEHPGNGRMGRVRLRKESLELLETIHAALGSDSTWKGMWRLERGECKATAWKVHRDHADAEGYVILVLLEEGHKV